MEEALQKRNTDCVYFLASPLTCKKGIECEYRHSEIARLNPRDCWYWLAGSCLNPTCAFRHPPLDGRTETASESASASAHHQSAVPNKTNVPCYYYYNGFCNKGERCLFMHKPEDSAPTWKSSKQASTVVDGPPLRKNMPTGSYSGPAPAEINSFGTDSKSTSGYKVMPQSDSWEATPSTAAEQSAYPQIPETPSEEAATVKSNSPNHREGREGLVQRRSHESTDQSSGYQLDDHIEQEEWLESSPGFDVLVNDGSEDLDYEDDGLYVLQHDMEDREQSSQHLAYDFGDNIEYDPAYPDIRVSFGRGMPDCYDHLDEDICNTNRETPFSARERVLDHNLQQKRRLLQTEVDGVDLRDYLKKRRMDERQYANLFSGGSHSSHLIGKITEKACITDRGHIRGRLASKVEISVEARMESGTRLSGTYRRRRTRHPHTNRSRQQTNERKQGKRQIFSEISGKTGSRKRRSAEKSTMFTGPKSLAQIKEEKKTDRGSRDFSH